MMRIMNLAGFHMNLVGFHPFISGGELTEYIFANILIHRSIAVEAVPPAGRACVVHVPLDRAGVAPA